MKIEPNNIYNGDCLELMQYIDSQSIDMILADNPYQKTQNSWDSLIPLSKYIVRKNKVIYEKDFLFQELLKERKLKDIRQEFQDEAKDGLWENYLRIIKSNGAIVLFAQDKFSAQLMLSQPKLHRYNLIYEKTTPTGFLNANKMPLRNHEDVLVFYQKLPTYNPQKTKGHSPVHSYTKHTSDGTNYGKTKLEISGGGSTERFPLSVIKFSTDKQKLSLHSTQKAVKAYEYYIKTFTNENEIVLDNASGSGTCAEACLNTNRKYICIEKNKKYFGDSIKRVQNYLERKL